MIICKNLDKNKAITNIDEWKNACKEEQWKDGRSAKELAKAWINSGCQIISGCLAQNLITYLIFCKLYTIDFTNAVDQRFIF